MAHEHSGDRRRDRADGPGCQEDKVGQEPVRIHPPGDEDLLQALAVALVEYRQRSPLAVLKCALLDTAPE